MLPLGSVSEDRASGLSTGQGEGQLEDGARKGKQQLCSVSAELIQNRFLWRVCVGEGGQGTWTIFLQHTGPCGPGLILLAWGTGEG